MSKVMLIFVAITIAGLAMLIVSRPAHDHTTPDTYGVVECGVTPSGHWATWNNDPCQ